MARKGKGKSFRVLVVDDQKSDRLRLQALAREAWNMHKQLCSDRSLEVKSANGASSAIRLLKKGAFDLVIADVFDSKNETLIHSEIINHLIEIGAETSVLITTSIHEKFVALPIGDDPDWPPWVEMVDKPTGDNKSKTLFFRMFHLVVQRSLAWARNWESYPFKQCFIDGVSEVIQNFTVALGNARQSQIVRLCARDGRGRDSEIMAAAQLLCEEAVARDKVVWHSHVGAGLTKHAIPELFGYDEVEGELTKTESRYCGFCFLISDYELDDDDIDLGARLLRVQSSGFSVPVGEAGTSLKHVGGPIIIGDCRSLACETLPPAWSKLLDVSTPVIELPGLSERSEDLVRLFKQIVDAESRQRSLVPPVLSPDAEDWLKSYQWNNDFTAFERLAKSFGGWVVEIAAGDLDEKVKGVSGRSVAGQGRTRGEGGKPDALNECKIEFRRRKDFKDGFRVEIESEGIGSSIDLSPTASILLLALAHFMEDRIQEGEKDEAELKDLKSYFGLGEQHIAYERRLESIENSRKMQFPGWVRTTVPANLSSVRGDLFRSILRKHDEESEGARVWLRLLSRVFDWTEGQKELGKEQPAYILNANKIDISHEFQSTGEGA